MGSETVTNNHSLLDETVDILDQAAEKAGRFLADNVGSDGNFRGRSHYGEAYACSLWQSMGGPYNELIEPSLAAIQRWDSDVPGVERPEESQWEFILHGAHRALTERPDWQTRFYAQWHESRPRITNYRLLRALARFRSGRQGRISSAIYGYWPTIRPPGTKWKIMRPANGLIQDDIRSYSFQYSAFSAVLLHELSQETGSGLLSRRFLSAVDSIIPFVLPGGDFTYVGRGQHQSFGYAAAIYALAASNRIRSRDDQILKLNQIARKLVQYQQPDGSIPLVIHGPIEQAFEDDQLKQDNPAWYSYNNLFDYLPFTAELIRRATLQLKNTQSTNKSNRPRTIVPKDQFHIHKTRTYTAIVSRPHGDRSNDLSQPLINVDKTTVTPHFGGDQIRSEISDPLNHSLPVIELDDGSQYAFIDELTYQLKGTQISGTSEHFGHVRKYEFGIKTVKMLDSIVIRKGQRELALLGVQMNWQFFGIEQSSAASSKPRYNLLDQQGKIWGWLDTDGRSGVSDDDQYLSAAGKLTAVSIRQKIDPSQRFQFHITTTISLDLGESV